MRVCYITMVFPAATETFACVDVRALRATGVSVSVFALRSARPRGLDEPRRLFAGPARTQAAARLLAERGLADLDVSHGSWFAVLRGLRFAARNPRIAADLLAWIWRHCARSPRHFLKSLVLVPRALDIFSSLRSAPPDVVHLFWGHYPAIVGYLVERYLPDVVLSMFLGAYDLGAPYPGSSEVAARANVVWTHARVNVPVIERLGVPPPRIRVAHRGIDLHEFAEPRGDKVPRRLVASGRLGAFKAMDQVIAILAALVPAWPDATLTILGDGPERRRLASLTRRLGVDRAVTFRGHLTHAQVQQEMAAAPVLVHMSTTERLPNVVKEAMASRCVCVVADTPGIRELIRDGHDGYVVAQGDIAGAALRIAEVFCQPAQRAAMGAAARARIVADFDVTQSIEGYRHCWSELREARYTVV